MIGRMKATCKCSDGGMIVLMTMRSETGIAHQEVVNFELASSI